MKDYIDKETIILGAYSLATVLTGLGAYSKNKTEFYIGVGIAGITALYQIGKGITNYFTRKSEEHKFREKESKLIEKTKDSN